MPANVEADTLKVYRVMVDGNPLFELVAESMERARALLASRLRTMEQQGYPTPTTPSQCSLTSIGTVKAT